MESAFEWCYASRSCRIAPTTVFALRGLRIIVGAVDAALQPGWLAANGVPLCSCASRSASWNWNEDRHVSSCQVDNRRTKLDVAHGVTRFSIASPSSVGPTVCLASCFALVAWCLRVKGLRLHTCGADAGITPHFQVAWGRKWGPHGRSQAKA